MSTVAEEAGDLQREGKREGGKEGRREEG